MENEVPKAFSLIRDYVKLPLAANAHYEQHEFRQLLAETASLNWFPEGISNEHKAELPQADTLLYHVKKITPKQVQTQFDHAVKAGIMKAKRMNLLNKPVCLAIDMNFQEFYGKPTSFTRGGKHKNGTNDFFAYATASIVEPGRRLVIAALPYTPLDSTVDILEKLLQKCSELVKIKLLLLDRGFFSSEVTRLLESKRQFYVMPAVRNEKIVELEKTVDCFPFTANYELNKQPVKLVFVKDEDDTLIFCTNLPCWRNKLTEYYAKRWGIETGYRVAGDFRLKTCSKDFSVRLFFYYFSLLFYNCWVLANALSVGVRHFITLALRVIVLKEAFSSSEESPPPLF